MPQIVHFDHLVERRSADAHTGEATLSTAALSRPTVGG
jgi:hypothetical protein